jgi:hypothetical protein
MLDRLDLFHRIQFGLVLFRSHMIALMPRKTIAILLQTACDGWCSARRSELNLPAIGSGIAAV